MMMNSLYKGFELFLFLGNMLLPFIRMIVYLFHGFFSEFSKYII